jgi:hypothetical protein
MSSDFEISFSEETQAWIDELYKEYQRDFEPISKERFLIECLQFGLNHIRSELDREKAKKEWDEQSDRRSRPKKNSAKIISSQRD